jgi:hypothetical protein
MKEKPDVSPQLDSALKSAQEYFNFSLDKTTWDRNGGLALSVERFIQALEMLDTGNARHQAAAHMAWEHYWLMLNTWSREPHLDAEALSKAILQCNSAVDALRGKPVVIGRLVEIAEELHLYLFAHGVTGPTSR